MAQTFRIVTALASRIEGLESSDHAQSLEIARLKATIATIQSSHNGRSPTAPAAAPLQPLRPTYSPAQPATSVGRPSGGVNFSLPAPASPVNVGFSPTSPYSSYIPVPPPLTRANTFNDFSTSPVPNTPLNQSLLDGGVPQPSPGLGDRYGGSDPFDFAAGGAINAGPGMGFFPGGMLSASPGTTNPRRSRIRSASEGLHVQPHRPRGPSFSAIAPIVAQAKWMAQQQPIVASGPLGLPGPVPPPEHINYRALVEHDLEIDADSFVRRILTHSDQQCSMYLQQRLKTTPHEARKTAIIQAVGRMLLDLCLSKFGNFLVSRCLEQGGLDLAVSWAKALQGHLLALSLDPFGCHCVQKLLDCGDRTTKNVVVDEIIDHAETLTQKNSGHVWSKLLATVNPPSFYERLSATGAGSWATIAKEETGSLVVQSILESWEGAYSSSIATDCEQDIIGLATSQWGSFVLLHLIEHGASVFWRRAVQPSPLLSLDHFGAKAVEKAFKTGQVPLEVVSAYVDCICRPWEGGRPAVIEIASHASGSQLLTLMFTGSLTTYDDKTKLIHAVRSFGVTLKQNKYGQKIYFLCERARSWAG